MNRKQILVVQLSLYAAMAFCIVMIGCGHSDPKQAEQEPIKPSRINGQRLSTPSDVPDLYEFNIDGHIYLSLAKDQSCLIHHAGCPCMTNRLNQTK
jgi:hypothetical protein